MPPSRLTAIQAVLILGAAAAVTGMGIRLLHQDRALEDQEIRKRLDQEIDAATVLIERALTQTAAAMRQPDFTPPPGAVLIRATPHDTQITPPGVLLFVPVHPKTPPDAESFTAAEREEFAHGNLDKAAALYRAAGTPAALVRLARVQRKQGRTAEALATYSKLLESTGYFEETPIPLLAALARAELCSGGDTQPLTRILDHPPLPLTRDIFLFHAQRAAELSAGKWRPDPAKLALSEAIHTAAASTTPTSSSGDLTILTHRDGERLTILTAPTTRFAARTRVHTGPQQSPAISRPPAATGLPWPISLPEPPPENLLGGRRRILALGTVTVPLLILLTGFLSARAVARERAATAMQADFVAAVSHEFRTPLTALRQFTGLLLDRDNLTDAQRRTCYEAQVRSTDRLSRLVESLLDFRRMEAGARPYHFEHLDASALLAKVAGDFQSESKVVIDLEAPPGHHLEADSAAITLALWNLLDNAVKYGQPPFELNLSRGPDQTRIRVTDHGPGIPQEETKRIFQRFYRGAGARTGEVKGTGIGLAMVRHIAEAHRGRVDVQSRPGQQTTFTLILPNN